MNKFLARLLAGVGAVAGFTAVQSAGAAGPDFTTLTGGVDWSTTGPAILLVTVGIVGVYVIIKASGLILTRIKSA